MRKLSYMLVILGLILVGCDSDSGGDDSSDTDVFVGTWALGGISDADGDRTAAFAQGYESITIAFTSAGNITLSVDAVTGGPAQDASFTGTYTVNESASTVTATLSTGATSLPLTFAYDIESDSRMEFTTQGNTSTLLANLFQTTFNPPVVIVLIKG